MIKRLARCIREYKWASFLSPLCMVGEVTMEVFIPLILTELLRQGIEPGYMPAVWKYGGLLALFALCSLAFGVASAFFAAYASTGFARNLRHDMFHKVQTYDFSNIDKFSASSIVTRLTSDVATLQMTYQMSIRMIFRTPVMVVMALILAFRISPRLSVIYCIMLPLLAMGLILLIKLVHPIFTRVFKSYDNLNNVVQENVRGVRVVKSFVRQKKETEKFTETSDTIYKDFLKAERIMAFNNPLMQFAVYTCVIVISYLGAKMVVGSQLDAPALTTMFTYTSQILMGLMMMSMVFVMFTMSREPMQRAYELLTETPDLKNPENPVTEVKDGSIDFEGVCFRYAKTAGRNALDHIDLHIDPGMTVGILGGTGSSKSTLVQLIPRLYDVTEGRLLVGGVDVREYDIKTLRDSVSMVLQKNVLFSGTIKENLRWGDPQATDEEMVHACKLACAHDFIASFPDGYDTHIEQGGTNVSGGQKQRLCIARALLKKPKILILDDSTSAVDTHTDAMIRKAFREEIPGTTKLIIAQRVASVQDADMIIVLDGGKIAATGTHDELLVRSEIYREVYESQVKGGQE